MRFLDKLLTRYFFLTSLILSIFCLCAFIIVLQFKIANLDTLSKFIDSYFKTVAVIIGATWVLNRFFMQRTDVTQLKVDADVNLVKYGDSSFNLLIYRLDVINTGKTLILPYRQFLRIESVSPFKSRIQYNLLYRWPTSDKHPGGPIEPNSWAAINDSISISKDILAVRIYLEIELSDKNMWNWHKTFSLVNENKI